MESENARRRVRRASVRLCRLCMVRFRHEMSIIDTQVLSHWFKGTGTRPSSQEVSISAITANEFLLAQPQDANRPDYYVLHPAKYGHLAMAEPGYFAPDHIGNPKWAERGFRRTDQVVIDFGNQYPSYREFGCEAISAIVNEKLPELYKMSIAHLPKDKQKYLRKRLRFILDSDVSCHPLNSATIEVAMALFSDFTAQYSCKDNVRNTVNDILILATAVIRGVPLVTHDSLLNRFAADNFSAPVKEDADGIVIEFSSEEAKHNTRSRESKGYINRGWRYSVRNNRAVSGT